MLRVNSELSSEICGMDCCIVHSEQRCSMSFEVAFSTRTVRITREGAEVGVRYGGAQSLALWVRSTSVYSRVSL